MTRSTIVASLSAVLLMSPPVYSLQHGRGGAPKATAPAPRGPSAKPSAPKPQPGAARAAAQKPAARPTSPKPGGRSTGGASAASSKKPAAVTAGKTAKTPSTKSAKSTKKSETTTAAKSMKKTTTTASTSTTTASLTPVQQKLQQNTNLAAKLRSRLPAGTDLMTASAGFRNLGQFVAAVNVSNNLNIPFADLKTKMVTDGKSLGQSIQALRPVASATVEAQRAEYDARTMIAESETAAPTSDATTATKKGRKPSSSGGAHE